MLARQRPHRSGPRGGGIWLALSLLIGGALGGYYHQGSLGVVIGLVVGLALAVLGSWHRRRGI